MDLTFDDIVTILQTSDEGDILEFKESPNVNELGATMSAMATANGGRILVGITNDKKIVGINFHDKLIDEIINISRGCIDSPVNIKVQPVKFNSEKCIAIIDVSKGYRRPYGHHGVYYERRGKQDYKLLADEIQRMKNESLGVTFCKLPARNFERAAHIEDLDETKIIDYLKLAEKMRGKKINFIDKNQTLSNLDLLCEGGVQVRNAAILFFGKEPQKFVPQSRINITVYPGNETESTFLLKRIIEGDIIELIDSVVLLIQRSNKNPIFVIKNLKRIEVEEYPYEAIREAIINAVAHRDYFADGAEISVKVFKDRIEIENPGGLPFQGVTKEDLEKDAGKSARRNEKIAELLDNIGWMEEAGSGIKRMKILMKEHGLQEPRLQINEKWFKVVFFGPGDKFSELINVSQHLKIKDLSYLNERQIKVLEYLLETKGSITNKKYREMFGVNDVTAFRDLSDLVYASLLKPMGVTRGAYYVLAS